MADQEYNIDVNTSQSGDGAAKTVEDLNKVQSVAEGSAAAQVEASAAVDAAANDSLDVLEELAAAVVRYNEALTSGDQEAAVDALREVREGMDELRESSEDVPEGLEEISEELKELEKLVQDDEGFDKLSDKVDGARESLSKLEKLEVAEAMGEVVTSSRSGGEALAELGKDGESMAESMLDGAEAVGDLASGVAQGFAVGGPIGAGIALVAAGMGFFVAKAKESAAAVDGLFTDIDEKFTQSESSIADVTRRVDAYTDAYKDANREIDLNLDKIQRSINLEDKKAQRSAQIRNDQAQLDRLRVINNKDLSEGERDAQLQEINEGVAAAEFEAKAADMERRQAENQAKLGAIQAELDGLQAELSAAQGQRNGLRDEEQINTDIEANRAGVNRAANNAEEIINNIAGTDQLVKIKDELVDVAKSLNNADTVEKQEKATESLLKVLSDFESNRDDKSIEQLDLENALGNLLAKSAQLPLKEAELKNTQEADQRLERARKAIVDDGQGLNNDAVSLNRNTEDIRADQAALQRLRQIERQTQEEQRKGLEQEAARRKAEAEAKEAAKVAKAAADAERSQSALDGAELGAVGPANKLVDTLSGKASRAELKKLSVLSKSLADGADSAELQELLEFSKSMLEGMVKRGNMDTNLVNELTTMRAKLQQQQAKQQALEAKVKKMGLVARNNRGKG